MHSTDPIPDLLAAGWPLSPDTIAANRAASYPAPLSTETPRKRARSTLANPLGEDAMQIALMDWARQMIPRHPELEFLYHVPNGGKRSRVSGAMMKRLGLLAGVVDVCLPVARGGFHGLYGELKIYPNALQPSQKKFLEFVGGQGYYVGVWYDDWRIAATDIEAYLNGELKKESSHE